MTKISKYWISKPLMAKKNRNKTSSNQLASINLTSRLAHASTFKSNALYRQATPTSKRKTMAPLSYTMSSLSMLSNSLTCSINTRHR